MKNDVTTVSAFQMNCYIFKLFWLILSVVDVPSVVPSSRVSVEAPSHQAFLFSPFCLLNFLGCEMELKKGEDIRF